MCRKKHHKLKISCAWALSFPFSLPSFLPTSLHHHPPTPPRWLYSLCTLILLFFVFVVSPNPSACPPPWVLPSVCHPPSPVRAEGSPGSGAGRLPGCTGGARAFPPFIFQKTRWPSLMVGSRWSFCKSPRWLAPLQAQTCSLRAAALEFSKRCKRKEGFFWISTFLSKC